LLAGLVLAAAAIIVWLRRHDSRVPVPPEQLPPVSRGPWLNTSPETAYVGTATCIACHPAQHESYLTTLHSRSLRKVDASSEPADGAFANPRTSLVYSAYREGEKLRHRQSLRTAEGTEIVLADHALRYAVGSGHLSRTYLVEIDGFLVESPMTWYASQEKWGLSPGYEQQDSGFARPVYFDCLNCHAGHVEGASDSDGRLAVSDLAIGCERCHGPGELHVRQREAVSASSGPVDRTIVNPARLDRERQESVCAQCHLDGKAAVEMSGRRARDYRPGLLWTDFRVDYTLESHMLESGRGSMAVVGHVEQMRASRCYLESATLTCTTCHDPHGRQSNDDRAAAYRETCLACHAERGCRIAEPERRSKTAKDDCTVCHMPQTASDVPHVAATHHRIGIYAADFKEGEGPEAGALRPLWRAAPLPRFEDERDRGLAYLQLSLKEPVAERSENYRLRSRDLLRGVLREFPGDSEVLAALAQLDLVDHPTRAADFAEQVLQQKGVAPRTRVRALFALSEAYFKQQRFGEAGPVLEQLVKIRRQGADWFRLALCRYRSGDMAKAAGAAAAAVEIMPEQPGFRELLAELADQTGDAPGAENQRRLARQLRALRAGE
jgi:tetratricopeptide (TPR) repeat protein